VNKGDEPVLELHTSTPVDGYLGIVTVGPPDFKLEEPDGD
jgi:hypothetical protein